MKTQLEETNKMRKFMGLPILVEEVVKKEEDKDVEAIAEVEGDGEEGGGEPADDEVTNNAVDEGHDCREHDSWGVSHEDWEKNKLAEDSEGRETYHYGEDEGEDREEEEHLEHEEEMAPADRIKEIERHLDALKKDMGYDEDHEDRDEEGTHFAEQKKIRTNKKIIKLTEGDLNKVVNRVIREDKKQKSYGKVR